jgi:insertion element IS1 protein InsB
LGAEDQSNHGGAPFKKLSLPLVNPLALEAVALEHELELVCKLDEQWSFVGKKSKSCWLGYVWSPHFKRVFAYTFGRWGDECLKQLLDLLERFMLRLYCTDDWGAYRWLLPEDQHLITKRYTQSIERQNLNWRTHLKHLARKTIYFSQSVEAHDKVVGEYIARHFFQRV